MTMQVFVRDHLTMIAASVQCDIDGIPKGPHEAKVPPDCSKYQMGPSEICMPFAIAHTTQTYPASCAPGP